MTNSEDTQLLREIRDLLQIMAEPQIEQRDKRLRSELRKIVGNGKKQAAAALLFDGSKTRPLICAESGIDTGNLSRLLTSLRKAGLLKGDDKQPQLSILVPPTFFERSEDHE